MRSPASRYITGRKKSADKRLFIKLMYTGDVWVLKTANKYQLIFRPVFK